MGEAWKPIRTAPKDRVLQLHEEGMPPDTWMRGIWHSGEWRSLEAGQFGVALNPSRWRETEQ
jgi:hypothetical protein